MWPCGWVGVAALGLTSSFPSHLALLDLSWGAYFREYLVSSPTLLALLMTWVCIHVPSPENSSFALTGPPLQNVGLSGTYAPRSPPPTSVLRVQYPRRVLPLRLTKCASLRLLFAPGPRPGLIRPTADSGRQRTNMVSEECRTKEVPMVIH